MVGRNHNRNIMNKRYAGAKIFRLWQPKAEQGNSATEEPCHGLPRHTQERAFIVTLPTEYICLSDVLMF